jgi:hypothetical protein
VKLGIGTARVGIAGQRRRDDVLGKAEKRSGESGAELLR